MSEGERRLAAIMFTDMVGYTALGQRNESLSLALVEEQRKIIRPVLARHNGREIKTIGDAFLVEFPNALDSVRCAYDIQRATKEFNISLPVDKRIHLRIGLHLGDVVESRGDISGDAVNVASRIEPLAEDGGVCLTRQVYESTCNKLEVPLVSMGMKSLKNVGEPMEVYKMQMPWKQPGLLTEVALLPRDRIAILPFRNMSPDPNDEYFAEGMTEEIISTVSGISGLRVVSRTSVMGYKGTTKNLKEIGRELDVGSVLEGSFRKAGNKMRVTAQLVDVAQDEHLWVRSYDRNLDDVFEVQSDIAKQVADALRVKILFPEKVRMEKKPTESVEAHTLYLKGVYHFNKVGVSVSGGELDKAIEYFQLACEQDPAFALAYAKVAECYVLIADITMPSKEAMPKAKEYAARALSLDEHLPEAHYTQAMIANQYDWDWAQAEKGFKEALSLNQSLADAHNYYAWFLAMMGRSEEAVSQATTACELDPMSPVTLQFSGSNCMFAAGYDRARAQATRALELAPGMAGAHAGLAILNAAEGKFEEAVREADEAAGLSGDTWTIQTQAQVYAMAGLKEKAKEMLDGVLSKKYPGYPNPSMIGSIYYLLGVEEKGWEWMQKAYETRDTGLPMHNRNPVMKAAREDPRYLDLLKRMGLD